MIGKLLGGRYRIVELIGEGGMANVYRATDIRTGRNVAVKVLKPNLAKDADYVSRFQREAEAASKMTHHNIVNLFDVGMDGDDRYLVMEYVRGSTLKEVIGGRPMNPYTAAQITIRILSALQHAHSNGIIHRDIKPQNILVNEERHIKVSDFGIARIADSNTITRGDVVMGSVHYFSPEQASGKPVDARTDIYSTGVVLYEMLTGRVPFDGEESVAVAMMHLHAQPTPIENIVTGVPAAISHVCMRALAKDPRNRYQTAYEMACDLRAAIDAGQGQADLSGSVHGMLVDGIVPSQMTEPPIRLNDGTGSGEKPRTSTGETRPPRRPNWVWWTVTLITTLAVLGALAIGAISIYNDVVRNVTVPDLVGLDRTAAETAAKKAGLNVEITEVTQDNRPAGQVVMQAPAGETSATKGDTIVITVSKGPAASLVPKLVGMTYQNAVTTAKEKGFDVTIVERVLSSDEYDFVLTQYPEGEDSAEPGTIIQVTVSGGAAAVPDVVGMTFAQAAEAIQSAGLSLSSSPEYITTEDASLHAKVAWQSPDPGLRVVRYTTVSLKVYQSPSMMHATEITLDLPDSEGQLAVTVTLSLPDGTGAVTAFTGVYPAGSTRHPAVTLTTQSAGTYKYTVQITGGTSGTKRYSKEITIP